MLFRSYLVILSLSIGWFGSSYPMIKAMKWTRNEQTVFLLGTACADKEHLQEEERQVDLVLRTLQERVQKNNRKIRILYEKAPAQVKAACALTDRNRDKPCRFGVNFDELIERLENPNFILQDVAIRLIERELIYALWLKDCPEFEDKHLDERAPKELRSITLDDFIEDLGLQERMLHEDLANIPTPAEKERCLEELEKATRALRFFKRDITQWDLPTDKPVVDFLQGIHDETCAELYENIRRGSRYFFEAFIGHQIMKSDHNEDLVVLVEHENVSYQHMIGLGWSSVYLPDKDYPMLMTEQELEYVLCNRAFPVKIIDRLQALASQTQQSVTSVYRSALSYLAKFKESQEQPQ